MVIGSASSATAAYARPIANGATECETRRLFTRAMADTVLALVASHPEAEAVVCQCDFGVSRSSALAASLGQILLGDASFIFDHVPARYRPNMHIHRLMLERHAALPLAS